MYNNKYSNTPYAPAVEELDLYMYVCMYHEKYLSESYEKYLKVDIYVTI